MARRPQLETLIARSFEGTYVLSVADMLIQASERRHVTSYADKMDGNELANSYQNLATQRQFFL